MSFKTHLSLILFFNFFSFTLFAQKSDNEIIIEVNQI